MTNPVTGLAARSGTETKVSLGLHSEALDLDIMGLQNCKVSFITLGFTGVLPRGGVWTSNSEPLKLALSLTTHTIRLVVELDD